MRIALRQRQHQYDVRDQMRRQEEQALELARSNTHLEQFSAAASHDLREPLRMITGYVTLLEQRNHAVFDDQSRHYIDHIVGSTKRMSGLIEAILNYAQVGKGQVTRSEFASAEAVGEALHNLELKVAQAQAQIQIDELPTITADRILIVQLFQNLISNALTYTRENPRVIIRAVDDGHQVIFVVEDNGVGIAEADLGRIFKAFERLHTKREHPGHGIGLSTCARIVAAHGGRIWVESTVGVGSSFFVSLPRSPA